MSDFTFQLIATVLKIAFVLALVVGLITPMLTLAERKISAWMQDRIGPNRAHFIKLGGKPLTLGGLFHTMADAVKMFVKEWTIPERADKLLFNLAPVLAIVPALLMFAVIPFGPSFELYGHRVDLQIANVNIGLLFIFALGSLGVYGAALAGWASNNKLALLGALRASAQTISYEVTFGLTLVGIMMVFGTMQLNVMVEQQAELLWGWLPKWGIFLQPAGFVLFFTAALAENKRIPFDLPEGESEIVGYFVEYSSMGFGLFMTAEFVEMVVIAFLTTTLFFGGYNIPYLSGDSFNAPWGLSFTLPAALSVALQFGAFMFKVVALLFLQFVIRWALPRFRYDQLMRLGWRVLLPFSLANILLTAVALIADESGTYVMLTGLAMIGVFVLSLFYQRPARMPAGEAVGSSHGHEAPSHG